MNKALKLFLVSFLSIYLIGIFFIDNSVSAHAEKKIEDMRKDFDKKKKSSKKYKDKVKKKTIQLKKFGDFQFEGANISPTKAVVKNKNLSLFFDWRNDTGYSDESSFNGSGVAVSLSQNGQELESNYADLLENTNSQLYQKIKKNTSLEMDFDYKLIDKKTPVTVKLTPLEGEVKEFTFNLK